MSVIETSQKDPKYLDTRFLAIKRSIIKSENIESVTQSWKRLLVALEEESKRISRLGSSAVPVISWDSIESNNYSLSDSDSKLFKESGVALVRGVIDKPQIEKWFNELAELIHKNSDTAGYKYSNSISIYNLFWTKPQTEARFHPNIVKLFKAFGNQFYVENESKAYLDLDTQVVYGDRIRIRQPGAVASLSLHVDSSSIERWEDEQFRASYKEIFEGNWEDWDPWKLDNKQFAQEDLYHHLGDQRIFTTCSTFRTLQGWLSLSDSKTGEGTLRVYPNVKLAAAYILLRPFFWKDPESGDINDYEIDLTTTRFPGTIPSSGLISIDDESFPHLQQIKSVVGIPNVEKGDFMFWHTDIPHEIDEKHPGENHSSVLYYAVCPLSPSNIHTLLDTRRAWSTNSSPIDFISQLEKNVVESQGADNSNLPNIDAYRSMGLSPFQLSNGLSESQLKIRKLANKALELNSFDLQAFLNTI